MKTSQSLNSSSTMEQRQHLVAALIARVTCQPLASIRDCRPLKGGCIHRVELIELSDGRRYCLKSNRDAGDMFAQEAYGLTAIRAVDCLATPVVIAVEPLTENESCLVLEAIQPGLPKASFWPEFGAGLANQHRRGSAHNYGWSSDNYLGSTLQKNEARGSWAEFFRDCRLNPQLHLARRNALGSVELFRCAGRVLDRLPQLLENGEARPSLLHGDLWSGNFLVGSQGNAVVIDPAVYYGNREAELAMPLLFGGFATEFFEAYQEAWPLGEGWQDRVEIYKLYHLMNHLNLFGSGYLDSCLEILRRYGS